jgi:uncharacterized membrane protein YgcG
MPSFFDQYSGVAGAAADQYNIPRPVFFGLIQTESSWNPNASPGTTSAYGFTQLTRGTAAQLGVNAADPTQNLYGGAKYLASMPGANWSEKLAHYYQGPHANIGQAGMDYANKVWSNAKNFFSGGTSGGSGGGNIVGTVASGAACVAGDPLACASAFGNLFGGGGSSGGGSDSCGINPICYLKQWIDASDFFSRIVLVVFALILILGGLYLYKQSN